MTNTSNKVRRNLLASFSAQLLTIILGVVIPRLVLISYGSEVNGLVNSVNQIYIYLSLLEAGIGGATLQALYRASGNKDRESINGILSATDNFYKRTGIYYLIGIFVFTSIYPIVVKTDIPVSTIVLVILLSGISGVLNYFFQAKYFLLLQAEGKVYIKSILVLFSDILRSLSKILLINLGFSIVTVLALSAIISIIQMAFLAIYIHKYYKWIDLKTAPNYEAISQSKNVMVHQISTLVFNNTDTVLLTFVCGLKAVSVYALYTMLYSMIKTALNNFTSSVVFALGQTYHIDKERYKSLHDCYELYYIAIVFSLYTIAYIFIEPFILCYTNGVNDISYTDVYLPLLFTLLFLLDGGRTPSNQTISIAGHFKQTQWRSVVETVINITVSVICVFRFGIYGVLIGTIAALLYRTNDMIIYSNRVIMKRSPLISYRRWLIDFVVFFLVINVNHYIAPTMSSYLDIVLWLLPYAVVIPSIFILFSSLFEPKTAKSMIHIITGHFILS